MGAPSPGSVGFRILVRASLPSLMERTAKEIGRKRKQEKGKEKGKEKRKGISMYACWFLAPQTQKSESKVAIVLLLASSGTIQLCVLGLHRGLPEGLGPSWGLPGVNLVRKLTGQWDP